MQPNDNNQPAEQQLNPPEYTPGIANSNPQQAQPETQAPQQSSEEQPTNPPETQAPQDSDNQQPTQQPETPEPAKQQTYEEYLDSLTKNAPEAPKIPDPNDPKYKTGNDEDLLQFFTDYEQSIKDSWRAEQQQQAIYQQAEQKVWGEAATKYPELNTSADLRETIQNIRLGIQQNTGKIVSPLEVADQLIGTLHNQYKKGINDQNVQTQIVNSQPTNGGGRPQVADNRINYEKVQSTNQNDVVSEVEKLISMNKI